MIKCDPMDRLKNTIMALYMSFVRPNLKYCTPIWNPHLIKDIKMIYVQHRTTNLIQDTGHWKYDDRLQDLGLTQLERKKLGAI